MEKLPEEIKQKWCAALKSGEYKQGTDVMYDKHTDGYCCLGVLGAICGASKSEMDVGYFDRDTENVPKDYPHLLLNDADLRGRLMTMNDIDRNSFSEIADYIEKNL